MEILEKRIRQDGELLPGNVLKVNSFLNHQIDPDLMFAIGQEFGKLFTGEKITKILTCEASGIAPALTTGLIFHVPIVFARKSKPSTLNKECYETEVFSYTKQVTNKINVDKKFLSKDDSVLIIDDFLANGEAVKGLINIVNQANSKVAGVGIVIEKTFQGGSKWITDNGYHLESLARIANFDNNTVHFVGEE